VCRGTWEGREVLGMKLTWDKRYITLAPIATLVGLAFRLEDPDHLLGEHDEIGITCALLPRDLPGMTIGDHHDPAGVPFPNGPIQGADVFIPLDYVIGGRDGCGKGWRMLMESLAAGRSISLPALSVGGAELATRVTGAYATIREQFGLPIGRFEGIEEPLARIAGRTYLMNATRLVTCGAVDAGEHPAVLSAIAKAYLTEGMRACINDAMDIQAGAAICRGPNNVLLRAYTGLPISITVEGANILSRSLIIFGQGVIRGHPYALAEMDSLAANDLAAFDRALCGHAGFFLGNAARSLGRALCPIGCDLARLSRFSAAFAFASDLALLQLGGSLKRRESLSGRFADMLAWLYIASSCWKLHQDRGQPAEDAQCYRWSLDYALWRVESALADLVRNYPSRLGRILLRLVTLPLGCWWAAPDDRLSAHLAQSLLDGGALRERLTQDIYLPEGEATGLCRLEEALAQTLATEQLRTNLMSAVKAGNIDRKPAETLVARAEAAGLISEAEASALRQAEAARRSAVQVDAFDPRTYSRLPG
ncbi:MAG: acyl-CoA dehydrogenase, partial [Rhodospirillales bacterium]